jgi:hypothetical protein
MLRFTIRDLLWVTVVVGLVLALSVHDFRWRASLRDAVRFYGGETMRARGEPAVEMDKRMKSEKANAALCRLLIAPIVAVALPPAVVSHRRIFGPRTGTSRRAQGNQFPVNPRLLLDE